MPTVMKMLDRASEEVSNCNVTQVNVLEFEVDHLTTSETYVVNLVERMCGFYRWELLGIPCYHAYACIYRKRLNVEDYVHEAYHVSTYARTYAPAFHPMPGKHQWPRVDLPQPMPPPFRKIPGRPKLKNRVKEQGEAQEKVLVKRDKRRNRFDNYGEEGHYANKCKNHPKLPTILPKGGRLRKNPAPSTVYSQPASTSASTGVQTSTTTGVQTSASTGVEQTSISASNVPAQVQPVAPINRKSTAASTSSATPTTKVAPRTSMTTRSAPPTLNAEPIRAKKPRCPAAPKVIPRTKKHKSMFEVVSSQTSTAAKP
uniref:SWIM-type domain-containing protein n=1 Tax=Chenopodium quinoa TaxID=63459 RepID=A0A803M6F5_CHEQI